MNNLGVNLKKLMVAAKISENELARRTGVSQQVINRIISGINSNPKIDTLSPLANYFLVSISQLIGDDQVFNREKSTGFRELPLINWNSLDSILLTENIDIKSLSSSLTVDIDTCGRLIAVKMIDNSMETKFSEGSLLIFDLDKKPCNGDFVLIQMSVNNIIFRQIIIKSSGNYQKAFNPNLDDFVPQKIPDKAKFLGVLIQSRTSYLSN